jgi:hypothetical protein
MPDAEKIVVLIRTALLTLNDALQTGNFTVLRDVGAPGFREANSAARLSQIFSNLMSQGVDLSAAATIAPQLAEAPVIDPKTNILRIKGWFPSQPLQVNFTLWFQPTAGRWRLFGISLNPDRTEGRYANSDCAISPHDFGDAARRPGKGTRRWG